MILPQKILTKHYGRGFTLIELLVVIAVVGVLAGAIIAVINPAEQLARSRDAGRKNAVEQLGKAMMAGAVINGQYYGAANNWLTSLQSSGGIKGVPSEITPRPNDVFCWDAWLLQNNYCYYTTVYNGKPEAWVWTNVESKAEMNKCGVTVSTFYYGPYYVYDSILNKACLKCLSDRGGETWVFSGACHPGE